MSYWHEPGPYEIMDFPDGTKPYDLESFTDDELVELKTIRPDLVKEIKAEQKRRAK